MILGKQFEGDTYALGRNGVPLKAVCRHCKSPCSGKTPRGLCHSCYYDLPIRSQYIDNLDDDSGRRGGGLGCPNGDLSRWCPTRYPPGSEGKIRVMQQRVALDLPIFHPDDATFANYVAQPMMRIGYNNG